MNTRSAIASSSRPRTPDRLRVAALAFLLAAATLAAFWDVVDQGFIKLDDPEYVEQNSRVRAGLTPDGLRYAFTTTDMGNWHPLTWLSLMLDVEWFGLDARGFHTTNLVLHVLNALALFAVLHRATGMTWRAATVAGLFALHPLHVESVAWISERKDLLSTLFWMLTLLVYLRYARKPSIGRYLPVFVMLALGLMAKPMLVTLPFVLLLLDVWPLGRVERFRPKTPARAPAPVSMLLLEKLPLFALSAVSSVVAVLAQGRAGSLRGTDTLDLGRRLANAIQNYGAYVRKMFWPDDLAVFYPHPSDVSLVAVAAAGLLLLVVSVLSVRYARPRPYLRVGWLWYLGTLVPVIGLVQVGGQAMADRYTYVPLIGLFILLVWLVSELGSTFSAGRLALPVLAVAVLAACLVSVRVQVSYWEDTGTLFGRALEVTDDNYLAHDYVGVALLEQGELEQAGRHFAEAVRILPTFAPAHVHLGVARTRQGDLRGAIANFRDAIELDPSLAQAHNNLGVALAGGGDYPGAAEAFAAAVDLRPEDADTHRNLGLALTRTGKVRQGIEHYRTALRLRPGMSTAAIPLASLLATHPDPRIRNGSEAVAIAEELCRASGGGDPRELEVLAAAYAESNRFSEAVDAAERALRAAHGSGEARLVEVILSRLELYRSGRPARTGMRPTRRSER